MDAPRTRPPVVACVITAVLMLASAGPAHGQTKFYFHDATTPNIGTLPGGTTLSATTPNVTATGAGTNRDMNQTIGTSQASAALDTLGQTTLQRNWFRRFLSRPLAAQTLPTGIWTIQGGAEEEQNQSNMLPWGAVIKVWRPSTGTTVATLLDNPTLGTTEAGTSETNISSSTGSISGVAVNDGDILVVELWAENTQGNGQSRTNTIYYDGTTEGSTTSNAAYLQAPGAISFYRSVRQSAYRLFSNANSTNVGTTLAAQNSAATLGASGDAFRLRMLLHVDDINLAASGQAFKLQFAPRSGTCDTAFSGETYADVTTTSVIAFNNNATPADGASLTASANDPTHGAHTVVNQTYEELNNFTNSTAINAGQDGKWDFSLFDNGAPGNTSYCFRVAKSTGVVLDTYTVIPEITTAAPLVVGSFNAYESSTAAGAISGAITTKISGTTVSLDIIALNAAKTAIATTFTGTVRVEVLNASDNSGALDANGCRPTWTAIQTLSPDPAFAAGNNGRKTISFTQANSYANARLRITFPAGAPTATGCSTNNFAIRPNALANLNASDTDWLTAGTGRSLSDVTFGSVTHKAGRPFSVRATAVNAAGTPATTTNYSGAPTVNVTACSGAACTATVATLSLTSTFASGQLVSAVASYPDVGAFQLQLVDEDFASVDAGDTAGDCTSAGRYVCSSAVNVGRFVPDHFAIASSSIVPRSDIAACSGSTFTYLDERMNLQMSLEARDSSGAVTSRYAGTWARLDVTNANKYDFGAIDSTAPTLLTGRITRLPPTASWSAGVATVTAPISINRAAAPDGPFAATRIGIAPVDDDLVALGTLNLDADNSGSNERGQVGGNTSLRFGILRLENAVGSEKLDLPVAIQLQYYSGTSFTRNTDDTCTSISAANLAFSSYFGGITAANMNGTHISGLGTAFSSGFLTLTAPTPVPASAGAVTLTINLTAEAKSYLKGNWGVSTYTADPTSRDAFGFYGIQSQPNSLIYFRENY